MSKLKAAIFAIVIASSLLLSGVPLVASESNAEETTEDYGAAVGMDMDEINGFIQSLIGKSVEDLIDGLFVSLDGYRINFVPDMNMHIASERIQTTTETEFLIHDRLSSFFNISAVFNGIGNFPEAGTYESHENEGGWDLLVRILNEQKSDQERELTAELLFGVFVEANIEMNVDPSTGELRGSDANFKLLIYLDEEENFSIDFDDVSETVKDVTIRYGEQKSHSNIYANLGFTMDIEDMPLLTDKESWTAHPSATVHTYKSSVSSDFAGNLWEIIQSNIDIDKVNTSVPELLLNIVKSTDKMVDLGTIIKSLTDVDLPELTFEADMTLSNMTDDDGNRFIAISVETTEGPVSFKLPLDASEYDLTEYLDLIPNDVLSQDNKDLLKIVMTIAGMDVLKLEDLSENPDTKQDVKEVQDVVDMAIEYDEDYDFKIPVEYIAIAAIVMMVTLVAVLMWGRGL